MSAHYSLISEEIIFEGEKRVVYGIEVGESQTQIHNVSANKEALELLICRCNKLSLSEIHILDICEDFLLYDL